MCSRHQPENGADSEQETPDRRDDDLVTGRAFGDAIPPPSGLVSLDHMRCPKCRTWSEEPPLTWRAANAGCSEWHHGSSEHFDVRCPRCDYVMWLDMPTDESSDD